MDGLYDVKDIKEMNTFIAKVGNMASKALADGKIDSADAPLTIEPLMAAPAAFEGITNYGKQFADMSEAEALEVKEQLAADLELDPKDKELEALAELICGATFQISAAVMAVVKAKQAKAAEQPAS